MSRSFDMTAGYGCSVEQVHDSLRDRGYWLARLQQSGADDATLDELRPDPSGGVEVRTTQIMHATRLPAVVHQLHGGGDLSFVRHEVWGPVAAGLADATVHATIAGAPASLAGTMALRPDVGTARLQVQVSVTVRIPFVGGKVENFIGGQLLGLLTAEQQFTDRWIRDHCGPTG